MKRSMVFYLVSLAVILVMAYSSPAQSTTYYVSQDGADRNNGLGWAQAWRTLEHAGYTARAGDLVIVRRGSEPYHYLPVSHAGSKAEPIVFRGESKDSLPVVTGGIKESRWEPSNTQGVWRVKTSASPILVMEDGKPLVAATSTSCNDGQWYWENGELRYRPSSGEPSNHDVWRANTGGGIQLGNNSWIVVEDFECWLGQGACIGIDKGSYNVIQGIHAQWYARGIQIRGGHHNDVADGLFENNREGVYLLDGAAQNTIRGCKVLHNGKSPTWKKGDRSGIAIGDVGVNIGNQLIANEVAFNGGPNSDPGLIAYSAPETIITSNNVHDNYSGGILIGILSDHSSAVGNRVVQNGELAVLSGEGNVSGLSVRRSGGVTVSNNEVRQNYVSPSDSNRYVDRTGGGIDLKGNQGDNMRGNKFIDNIVCGTKNGPDIYLSPLPDITGLVLQEPVSDQSLGNTSIGCSGSHSSDVAPPAPPTGLNLR
jgi:hypothetical protein